MGNLKSIDNKTLVKVMLASSTFMTIQLITSRRARRWMINTQLIVLYILSFLLATGSLGVMLLKYRSKDSNPGSEKNDKNTKTKLQR